VRGAASIDNTPDNCQCGAGNLSPNHSYLRPRDIEKQTEKLNTALMKDLTSPGWIKLKGLLFLLVGSLSALLLILEQPTLRASTLLFLSVWCFCRFYYFAFYVIEHYVDPSYRFSGLGSFLVYLLKRKT
jgi:hypothetical protein